MTSNVFISFFKNLLKPFTTQWQAFFHLYTIKRKLLISNWLRNQSFKSSHDVKIFLFVFGRSFWIGITSYNCFSIRSYFNNKTLRIGMLFSNIVKTPYI